MAARPPPRVQMLPWEPAFTRVRDPLHQPLTGVQTGQKTPARVSRKGGRPEGLPRDLCRVGTDRTLSLRSQVGGRV